MFKQTNTSEGLRFTPSTSFLNDKKTKSHGAQVQQSRSIRSSSSQVRLIERTLLKSPRKLIEILMASLVNIKHAPKADQENSPQTSPPPPKKKKNPLGSALLFLQALKYTRHKPRASDLAAAYIAALPTTVFLLVFSLRIFASQTQTLS